MQYSDHEIICYGDGAYMWVVTDSVTKDFWIFYDGEKAQDFATQRKNSFGNKLWVETKRIEDMYEERDEEKLDEIQNY